MGWCQFHAEVFKFVSQLVSHLQVPYVWMCVSMPLYNCINAYSYVYGFKGIPPKDRKVRKVTNAHIFGRSSMK